MFTTNLEKNLNNIEKLHEVCSASRPTHLIIFDYQAALTDYAFTSFMAGTGAEGFETKMNELKQFFSKTPAKETPKDPE